MMPEQIAEVCHEVNRAYREAIGEDPGANWDNATPHQRTSCRNGVLFHIENPNANPEQSHQEWMREKLDAGWVWGEEKNEEVRTHPCLVPYNELPQEQRVKDHLFKAIVKQLRFR